MKKSFLSAAALVLAMGLSAHAQDDYEDYAYDEGVAESAPEGYSEVSDDAELAADAATARGRIEEQKASKASAAAAESSSGSSAMDKPFRIGFHLGLGLSGTYGNEEALGNFYNPDTHSYNLAYKDPFEGYLGVNVDIGAIFLYRINKLLSIAPELNIRIIDYFKESDVWTIDVYDDWGYYQGTEPVDENMMLVDISIPIMLRVTPVPSFYVEAGVQLNLNLMGSFSLDNSDYDYEEDMGDWKGETFGYSINIGGGVIKPAEFGSVEVGGRLVLDMTRLEADEVVLNEANGSFRNPVATKGWHVQVVCNVIF